MSREPRLPRLTIDIISRHATKSPKRDRKAIIKDIEAELKKRGLRIPSIATLLREISDARRNGTTAFDKPWSIACQGEPTTAVPETALPFVIRAFFVSLADFKKPPTIREAMWFSRLYAFGVHLHRIESPDRTEDDHSQLAISNTLRWAIDYAARDRVCEKDKRPLDTSDLDGALLHQYLYLDQVISEDFGLPPAGVTPFRMAMAEALAENNIPKPTWLNLR